MIHMNNIVVERIKSSNILKASKKIEKEQFNLQNKDEYITDKINIKDDDVLDGEIYGYMIMVNKSVASVVYIEIDKNCIYLNTVMTAKKYEGYGLASTLLMFVTSFARLHKIKCIWLKINAENKTNAIKLKKFYEKFGYKQSNNPSNYTIYYKNSIIMELLLK